MNRNLKAIASLVLVSAVTVAYAQPPAAAPAPAKHHSTSVEQQIKALQEQMNQQRQEINALREELNQRNQQLKQAQSAAQQSQSAAQQAQEMVPDGVTVVSALHTVSAPTLADLAKNLDEDVLLCGDRKADKAKVARLVEEIDEGDDTHDAWIGVGEPVVGASGFVGTVVSAPAMGAIPPRLHAARASFHHPDLRRRTAGVNWDQRDRTPSPTPSAGSPVASTRSSSACAWTPATWPCRSPTR